MNPHLSNFHEALVFAEECNIDTSHLRANAESIVSDFVRLNQDEIAALEADPDQGEGAASFFFGIAITLNDQPEHLSAAMTAYAEQFRTQHPVTYIEEEQPSL